MRCTTKSRGILLSLSNVGDPVATVAFGDVEVWEGRLLTSLNFRCSRKTLRRYASSFSCLCRVIMSSSSWALWSVIGVSNGSYGVSKILPLGTGNMFLATVVCARSSGVAGCPRKETVAELPTSLRPILASMVTSSSVFLCILSVVGGLSSMFFSLPISILAWGTKESLIAFGVCPRNVPLVYAPLCF